MLLPGPSKVEVRKFTRSDDDEELAREVINDWTSRSQQEGLCGIVNCYNKPTSKCKKCGNYYCQEHFKSHYDLVPNRESNNRKGERQLHMMICLMHIGWLCSFGVIL